MSLNSVDYRNLFFRLRFVVISVKRTFLLFVMYNCDKVFTHLATGCDTLLNDVIFELVHFIKLVEKCSN